VNNTTAVNDVPVLIGPGNRINAASGDVSLQRSTTEPEA
jgi:hypothetical protein